MADAVTTQKIQDGDRLAILKFTNISDGTGESGVTKVDVSTLAPESGTAKACTEVKIQQIFYSLSGMGVDILWEATADVLAFTVTDSSDGRFDFSEIGALTNTAGAGKTGDVAFTTVGATAGDRYTIILVLEKKYS
jgi:hypothetical protein